MGFKENKLEIAMVVAAVALVGGLGNLFKAPVQKALNNTDFSFEMIRPKSVLAALFDLGGREVSRSYVNPFGNKKDAKTTTPNTEDHTQKNTTTAKADTKKAAEKKATDDKKPKTEITVVGADEGRKVGGDELSTGNGGGSQSVANNNEGKKNGSDSDSDKNKKSYEEWRSLVLGQPTKENVNKMVLAYMDAELTDGQFFGIVKELLQNSNTETQGLGLSAASSFYNSTAFNTVASSYKTISTDNQTKAMAYLLGFANAGRLGALATSLKNSNADVVELAAEVVVKGYASAKNGSTSGQGGRTRGDAFENSLTSYSQFTKIFQDLVSKGSSAEIQSIATTALSQIQSGVASL